MTDINSEILKLKALINNKQTTSIYSNKSYEADSIAHENMKLYVNDMTKKFTFTSSNTNTPITIDPRTKTISNVDYIDDLKLSDIKTFKDELDAEVEARIAGDAELESSKADVIHTHSISDVSDLQTALDGKADTSHTHAISDITNLQTTLNSKTPLYTYNTVQAALNDWSNIADGSVVMAESGVEQYDATFIFKKSTFRALMIACNKVPKNYIWVRPVCKNISSAVSTSLSDLPFRKVPVLTTAGNLEISGTISSPTITNIQSDITNLSSSKAENSMLTALTARVAIVETGKADVNHNHDSTYSAINHTHTLSDITDYDTSGTEARITALENNKVDKSQIIQSAWKYKIDSITLSDDFLHFHGITNITNSNNQLKFTTLESFPENTTFYIYTGNGAEPERIDIYPTIEEASIEEEEEDAPLYQYTIDYSWYFLPDLRQWKYMFSYEYDGLTYETEIADITLSSSKSSATTTDTILSSDGVRELMNDYMERIYPVGCIYTSMTDLNPAYVFGFGTWTQITDRFLWCSSGTSGQTGGSKKISVDNLPAHSHHIDSYTNTDGAHKHTLLSEYDDFNGNMGSGFKDATMANAKFSLPNDTGTTGAVYTRNSYTQTDGSHKHRIQIDTQNKGSGTDYMPPYITVFAWYRSA